MPEGPEIWRSADQIQSVVGGKEIKDIYFKFEELKIYEEELNSRIIKNVKPRGKAITIHFDNGKVIYSHNQLYGKWFTADRGQEPDNNRSLRLAIHTHNKSAYLYSASEIEVLNADEVEEHSYIKKLGPDVVDPETTFEEVMDIYTSDTYQNRKVTTLLLDPGFLSGIGNYLRSEILFCAGIDPDYKLKECSQEQKKELARQSLDLPRRSYRLKGITTSDDLVKALREEGAPFSEYRHYVYGRAGKPCYKCGKEIQVLKIGGRKVYYCEERQKN